MHQVGRLDHTWRIWFVLHIRSVASLAMSKSEEITQFLSLLDLTAARRPLHT
jgi:hypothetical protein